MMEVSIRGPVWRAPCPHPMSPSCSLKPDCLPCRSAGQGAGGVTGDFATVIVLLDRNTDVIPILIMGKYSYFQLCRNSWGGILANPNCTAKERSPSMNHPIHIPPTAFFEFGQNGQHCMILLEN